MRLISVRKMETICKETSAAVRVKGGTSEESQSQTGKCMLRSLSFIFVMNMISENVSGKEEGLLRSILCAGDLALVADRRNGRKHCKNGMIFFRKNEYRDDRRGVER